MEETKKENKVLDFFIKTLNGMAYGLFATLIIGTIFGTIGSLFAKGSVEPRPYLHQISLYALPIPLSGRYVRQQSFLSPQLVVLSPLLPL